MTHTKAKKTIGKMNMKKQSDDREKKRAKYVQIKKGKSLISENGKERITQYQRNKRKKGKSLIKKKNIWRNPVTGGERAGTAAEVERNSGERRGEAVIKSSDFTVARDIEHMGRQTTA